jgi:cell shape-determining protein MreD
MAIRIINILCIGGIMMKDNEKNSKLGIYISIFAIIIASIAFIYTTIEGMPNWTSGIILLCTITIFFSSIAVCKSQKNKSSNSNKTLN